MSALTPPLAAEQGMRWMPRVAAEETLTMVPPALLDHGGRPVQADVDVAAGR